jgi:hypothetical protein
MEVCQRFLEAINFSQDYMASENASWILLLTGEFKYIKRCRLSLIERTITGSLRRLSRSTLQCTAQVAAQQVHFWGSEVTWLCANTMVKVMTPQLILAIALKRLIGGSIWYWLLLIEGKQTNWLFCVLLRCKNYFRGNFIIAHNASVCSMTKSHVRNHYLEWIPVML